MPHETDPPDFSSKRSKTRADFYIVIVKKPCSNRRFVNSLWHFDHIKLAQPNAAILHEHA